MYHPQLSKPVVLTNYSVAAGPLGVAILLTPFLLGASLFALMGVEGPLAYGLPAFFAMLLLGLW